MKYIVCTGNIVNGYCFIGSFDTIDDAIEFGEVELLDRTDEWWIGKLESVNEHTGDNIGQSSPRISLGVYDQETDFNFHDAEQELEGE